ncbi:MAG: [acyl-carrier-protein] S-malonyltransferase [Alphaproteobacteria bacterium]|nr:ACP S-malonyltransferase [Alphaproteobacteria bacterium]TAD91965.1 MAG: [acyl-carrier-protein] S-malonyltransferase [Alphaproteobacteria bacterium]
MFPGQGSQAIGMGQELAAAFPVARHLFQEVDDALDQHLFRLMAEGPESDLTLTRNTQPALMAVSVAATRVLEHLTGKPVHHLARAVLGHSLGEWSALVAVGALSVSDGARLLRRRGEAMQAAVPVGEGAMAAILGLEMPAVAALCEAAAQGDVVDPANDNGGGQVVISGTAAAVARAIALAPQHGAKRAIALNVSAPFHCRLMQPAADAMAEALATTEIRVPSVPLVANVTAVATSDPDAIRRQLVEQVTGVVRWRDCVAALPALGVDALAEVGSGKVLAGLARRIVKDLEAVGVATPAEAEALAARL